MQMEDPAPRAIYRSYSQLSQLRRCGESYRLSRIEKVPKRPVVTTEMGSAVHVVTEYIDEALDYGQFQDHESLAAEALTQGVAEFSRIMAKSEWPESEWKYYGRQDCKWAKKQGIKKCVDAYLAWRLESPFQIADIPSYGLALEVPFELDFGYFIITGRIDRVLFDPKTDQFYVLDIKSGLKPKTDEQIGLYRHALKVQYDLDVTWGGYLYGLKTGTAHLTKAVDLSHWTEEKLAGEYSKAHQMITEGLFLANPGPDCFTCDVSEHCSFQQASI